MAGFEKINILTKVNLFKRCFQGDKTCQLRGRDEIIGAEESVLQQNLKLPKMDDVWFWWKDQVHMNNLSSSIFAFHHSTGQFPNSFLVLSGKVISTYRFVKIY